MEPFWPPDDDGQGGDFSAPSAAYSSLLFTDGTIEGDDLAWLRERFGAEAADRIQHLRDVHESMRRPLTEDERAVLRESLAPVLRDIEATGAILPSARKDRHEPVGGNLVSAYIWGADGTGMGLVTPSAGAAAERVVRLADSVQEWEIEELAAAGRPATWPECPDHPDSHPLEPIVDGRNVAVWRCPRAGRVIGEIGTLGTRR